MTSTYPDNFREENYESDHEADAMFATQSLKSIKHKLIFVHLCLFCLKNNRNLNGVNEKDTTEYFIWQIKEDNAKIALAVLVLPFN